MPARPRAGGRDGPPDDPRLSRVLSGKYRLLRKLGEGGMALVYEAEHTWTRRRVAVKLLRVDLASRQEAVRRFLQEARAAARIAHPHIVDVLDMGSDDDGTIYLVHELLAGENLDQHLARAPGRRLPLDEALDLMIPLLGALAAAHERGIVHRDLKPANVLLAQSPSGELTPKLIDFGISKMAPGAALTEEDEPSPKVHTDSGMLLGTPAYMSPEQVRGRRDLDARTDVWAMGVMLYQMLVGARPFDGESVHDTMTRILTAPVPPLPAEVPALPSECHELLERSLAKDPEQRFPGVREQLEAALAIPSSSSSPRATDRRQLHARAIRPYPAAALDAEAQGREEALPLESLLTLGRPTTGAVPRTRWPIVATLLGLTLAVLAVAWWARGRDPLAIPQPAPPPVSRVQPQAVAPTDPSTATSQGNATTPPLPLPGPPPPVVAGPADRMEPKRAANVKVDRPRSTDGAAPSREALRDAAANRPLGPDVRPPSLVRGANDTPIIDD